MTKKDLIFAAILLLGYVGLSHQECWTRWFNRGTSGSGVYEDMADLRNDFPGQICANPTGIQVVTDQGVPAEQTGQTFYLYSADAGFVCRDVDQVNGRCLNYQVSFLCPCP